MNSIYQTESSEWKGLLHEALKKCLQNETITKKIAVSERNNDINILKCSIRRQHMDNWKKQLNIKLNVQKHVIRQHIDTLDLYWSGKITGEYIREYDATVLNQLKTAIDIFIKDNNEKIALTILNDNIDIVCDEIIKHI